LRWVPSNAEAPQIDTGRIILAGESAGATIALGIALRCRDDGEDQGIIGLSLVYSPLDDRTTAQPPHPYAGAIGLGAEHMRFAWASYLGDRETHDVSPYAAPARADSLAGLPPVFLAVGALDPVIERISLLHGVCSGKAPQRRCTYFQAHRVVLTGWRAHRLRSNCAHCATTI
jgi:acetyl esterase